MRFAATHKAVSYLMVATAFLVLALSGELPIELTAVTSLGLAASYFFDPQRHPFMGHRIYRYGWNLALLVVFGLSVMAWLRAEPLLTVGTRLLCCLLLAKLWNRKANRDYLHAYIISFFMLVAGSILNNNFVYAICFVGYVVFATWTLTLFHLRREMEENYLLKHLPGKDGKGAESERVEVDRILNSRRVVGPPFLLGTSVISLAIFLSSGVIFILTPRIGMGIDIPLQRHGLQTSGFSDRIELGGHGRIRDNPQVALRVELPAGKPPRPLYFRGVTFDQYDRGQWSRSKKLPLAPLGRYGNVYVLGEDSASLNYGKVERRLRSALRAEIYLEPLDVPVVLAPSRVLAIAPPPSMLPGSSVHLSPGPGGEIFLGERRAGVRYTAYSDVEPPSPARLAGAVDLGATHERSLDAYLLLPASLPPRVRKLAEDVTRSARGPHEKAMALLGYLQRSYSYTTTLGRDERFEPLEDFLFVQRKGHCEYFASALAVMLRAVGVPSRSVNGYLGGEWNDYGRYLIVRQQNAHSWVEAYLDGAGWVTYDPTPPSGLSGPQAGLWTMLRQLGDTLEMSWFKYVIEYDLRTQVQMAEGAISWLQRTRRGGGPGLAARLRQLKGYAGWGLGGVGAAGALLLLFLRLRGRRVGWGGTRRPIADQLLRRALLSLSRRGFAQRPGETLQQLAARAEEASEPAGAPFARLIEHYYSVRFGGEPLDGSVFRRLSAAVLQAPAAVPETKGGAGTPAGPAAAASAATEAGVEEAPRSPHI